MTENEVRRMKETDDEAQQENTKQFEIVMAEMLRDVDRMSKEAFEGFKRDCRDFERGCKQTIETWRFLRREIFMFNWGRTFINCVAAQYLRLLTGYPLRLGFKGSKISSSYYDPFLSLMAEEIGKSIEDTALLCDRVISAGHEAFAIGSCPGFEILVVAAQAHDKFTLLTIVHECRTHLETYSSLAAELPDQVALLVQAKILDELL